MVYLQHASDPIAWWNPDLLFRQPDWLREKRGYDVLPETEWIPVVTFLQVSADMAVAVDVPDGHGHLYVADVANGWAAVLSAAGVDAGEDRQAAPAAARQRQLSRRTAAEWAVSQRSRSTSQWQNQYPRPTRE